MTDPAGGDGGRTRKCPICGRSAEARWRPFCSRRCADVDLSRWLGGVYAVPVVEPDEDDESGLEELPGRPSRSDGDSVQ